MFASEASCGGTAATTPAWASSGTPEAGSFVAGPPFRRRRVRLKRGGASHPRWFGSPGRSLAGEVRRTPGGWDRQDDPLPGRFAAPPVDGIVRTIPYRGGSPHPRWMGSPGRSLAGEVRRTPVVRIARTIPCRGGSAHPRWFGSPGRSLGGEVRRTPGGWDRQDDPLPGRFAAPPVDGIVRTIPWRGGSPHPRWMGSPGRSLGGEVRRTPGGWDRQDDPLPGRFVAPPGGSDRQDDPLPGRFAAPPVDGIARTIPCRAGSSHPRWFGSPGRSLAGEVRRTPGGWDRQDDPLPGRFAVGAAHSGQVWAESQRVV